MSSVIISGDTSGSITLAAPAVSGSTTLTLPSTSGTVLTNASSLAGMSGYPVITLGTPVNSTSGTAIDFTGIPSGTKAIVISLVGVVLNSTANFLVQIGDSGGMETSGYASIAGRMDSAQYALSSDGFIVTVNHAASHLTQGIIRLALENSSSFTWTYGSILGQNVAQVMEFGAGSKSLSAELTQVRITSVSAGGSFTAGQINIQYS